MTETALNSKNNAFYLFDNYMILLLIILIIGIAILYLKNKYQLFSIISDKLNIPKRMKYIFKFFVLIIVLYYLIWNPLLTNTITENYLKLTIAAFLIIIMFKPFQNLISGILIFFNKNYPLGLPIAYQDKVGKIDDFKLFTIVLRLDDGNNLFIPNHDFINSSILDKSTLANENKIEFVLYVPKVGDKHALEVAEEAAISSNYLNYRSINEFLLEDKSTSKDGAKVKFIVYAINSSYREKLKSNIIEKISALSENYGTD